MKQMEQLKESMVILSLQVNTRQKCRHFPADTSKWIFLKKISMNISLKLVPKGEINNIPIRIGSDNGLAPTRRQAIIWTINDG